MLVHICLVLLALPIIITLYLQYLKSYKNGKKHHPPGPSGLPFIGNLHQFDGNTPHIYLWNLSKKYGPIMSMKLGYRPVLVVSSAKVVKEIMTSHDITFSGRPSMKGFKKLSYNGIDVALSSYNNVWRETRKLCTLHLFTVKQVQYFRPVREEEVSRMMEKIASNCSMSKMNNLSEMMISMTSNVICRIAFGKSYGDESYEKNRFYELLHGAQSVFGGFFVSDYFPLLGWVDKITGMNLNLEKVFKSLDSYYQEHIEEHLDYANRPKSMDGDILDLLLELKSDRSSPVDLTFEHIKALLMNILIGGTDTSTVVTIWGMTFLMKNPHVMKKVQAEIRDHVRNKDFIDEDDIKKLSYLQAVIKETFRMYSPLPILVPRETLQKCTLLGFEIQPKTLVYINAWAITRDPEIWENPEEFMPERFLDKDIDMKGRDPELIPFGIGRRGCPGISMGMATVELALANLLYKFNWELPDGMQKEDIDIDVSPGLAMHKKNPLCLVAKPVHS